MVWMINNIMDVSAFGFTQSKKMNRARCDLLVFPPLLSLFLAALNLKSEKWTAGTRLSEYSEINPNETRIVYFQLKLVMVWEILLQLLQLCLRFGLIICNLFQMKLYLLIYSSLKSWGGGKDHIYKVCAALSCI